MMGRTSDISEPLDRKTSRSICEAVGERLQRYLPPEESGLPGPLQGLIEELRKRDHPSGRFD